MTQGTNKQEKTSNHLEIYKAFVFNSSYKNYYAFKSHYLHRKKCILIDLHDYKMCTDFRVDVWVVFRSRSMKIDKMHQSSGFIWSVLLF